MDDAITRTFVTGPMVVGLSAALAFIEMSDDSLKEVMKQVAEASRDAAFGAAPPAGGGAPPFVAVANRPKPNVMTKNALVSFSFALKYMYQRGIAAGEDMVTSINDPKARAFFHRAMLVKKDKTDSDSDLELSVIPDRTSVPTLPPRSVDGIPP